MLELLHNLWVSHGIFGITMVITWRSRTTSGILLLRGGKFGGPRESFEWKSQESGGAHGEGVFGTLPPQPPPENPPPPARFAMRAPPPIGFNKSSRSTISIGN